MNGLDIVILATFFGSAFIGAMRGFTKEILSLFSWGGAAALAYVFLPLARAFVQPYIANPMMADAAALFCLFVLSLIVLSIIANIISGYIHESSFRGIDHSLGFAFGSLRGVVFISAAELFFSTFSPRHAQAPTIQSARFIPMARKGGDALLYILPSSLRTLILEQALKVENQVNAKVQDHLKSGIPNVLSGGNSKTNSEGIDTESILGGHAGTSSGESLAQRKSGYGGSASLSILPPAAGQRSMQPFSGSPQTPPPGSLPGSSSRLAPSQELHGMPVPSQMVVIRPPQPGQVPQLAPASRQPGGLGQSAMPQNKQATVDELARLKPQAPSKDKEDRGYTRGQRDDMNRLFQAADGE